MQLAFARVKETWEEAYLTNLATHPLETVLDRIRVAETVGLFTSEAEGPAEIARDAAGARPGLLPRLRLREPRRARRARHAGRAGRHRRHGVRPAQRRHPGPQARRAGPPGDAGAVPPLRQPRRLLRAEPAQERADHAERGAGAGAGADGDPAGQRGVGHRRRVGLGGHRGGGAVRAGHGLRHRAGRRRLSPDPRQRRDVRREEPQGGPRHGAGRVRRPAAPRRDLRRRRRPRGGAACWRRRGRRCGRAGSWSSTSRRSRTCRRPTPCCGGCRARCGRCWCSVARGVEQLESLRFESLNPTYLLAVGKPPA